MHLKLNPLLGSPHLIFTTTYESRFNLQEKKLRHRGWIKLAHSHPTVQHSGLFLQRTACSGEHGLRTENLRDIDFGFIWRKLPTAKAHLGMCNQGWEIIGPTCTAELKSKSVWTLKIMPVNPKVFWFLDTIIHVYRPHLCFVCLSLGQPHHRCVYGICFAHSSQRAGSGVLSTTLSHKHRLFYCFALENKAGLSKGTKTDFQRSKSRGLEATHTASNVWWMVASFLSDSLFWVLRFLCLSWCPVSAGRQSWQQPLGVYGNASPPWTCTKWPVASVHSRRASVSVPSHNSPTVCPLMEKGQLIRTLCAVDAAT